MKATLKKLIIENFKGVNLTIENPGNIFGENETRKTTIFDAYMWLLFGRDSQEKTDFPIMPINKETGETIHNVDVDVTGVFDIDGCITEYRRVFREKWEKKRGEEDVRFTGNKTIYYIDKLKQKRAKDYEDSISAIFNPKVFKILSDVWAFNNLKWEQRRAILEQLIPEITDHDICQGDEQLTELLNRLSGKDITVEKKKIKADIKALKDQLKDIQPRIDENFKNIPEQIDTDNIKTQIQAKKTKIAEIEKSIQDLSHSYNEKNKKNIELNNEIHELNLKISQIKNNIESQANSILNSLQNEKNKIKNSIQTNNQNLIYKQEELNNIEAMINSCNAKRNNLLKRYEDTENMELKADDKDLNCPRCNRPFDNIEEKKEQIIENLKKTRQNILDAINKEGIANNEQMNIYKKSRDNIKEEIESIKKDIIVFNETLNQLNKKNETTPKNTDELLKENSEYMSALNEIKDKESQIKEIEKPSYDSLNQQKSKVNAELEELNDILKKDETREEKLQRINELKEEQRQAGIKIAELEKQEFVFDKYEKNKSTIIEEKLNKKFNFVKFKMFKHYQHGGSEPTCTTIVDGIPYSGANNAAKINAGIDIINVLSEYHDLHVPLIVDNAESVNNFIDTDNQLIKLVVIDPDTDKEKLKKRGIVLYVNHS